MNQSDGKEWRFAPMDTWFFREARPYDFIGGTQLNTLFPPPARTVAGTVRTMIGELANVDWQDFHQNENHPLRQEIGDSEQLGKLKLVGPYLLYGNQRLYPVPLIVMEGFVANKHAQNTQFVLLQRGIEPVNCDLGYVYLPEVKSIANKEIDNLKPIENAWLTVENLQYVLNGTTPHDVTHRSELFDIENRLGIALNRKTRTAEELQLYQNQHIRPRYYSDLQVGVTVVGIDDALHPKETGFIRFGGEGRLAEVTVSSSLPARLKLPNLKKAKNGIFLTLLTPANLDKNWLPPGFREETDEKGVRVWRGTINRVELTIVCAVLGESIREGGWDLANKKPRKVISLVPAGSVWFCKVNKGNPANLHGYHIGKETALGWGELAVGVW